MLETTRQLWEECERQFLSRWKRRPGREQLTVDGVSGLASNHTYELIERDSKVRVSAVWTGSRFVPTLNRDWFGKQVDLAKPEDWFGKKTFEVRVPSGYGVADEEKTVGSCTVQRREQFGCEWHPYLQLQLDSREFQCVVPANEAMNLAAMIESAFSAQMARVKNRLPIHISVIAGESATPLRAFLDAAQRAQSRRPQERVRTIRYVHHEVTPEYGTRGFPAASSVSALQIGFDDSGDGVSIPVRFDGASESASNCLRIRRRHFIPRGSRSTFRLNL